MAEIVSFEGQNAVYTGPGCLDLPAFRSFDQFGNHVIACCYQLTEGERAELLQTGLLLHQLWTTTPQRDWITPTNPFNLLEGKTGNEVLRIPVHLGPVHSITGLNERREMSTVLVWKLSPDEVREIIENDGYAFSYLWALNPQPQYVTTYNFL